LKIVVFSDSHGANYSMISAIGSVSNINYIIHLGDYERDVYAIKDNFPKYDIINVAGNCDYSSNIPAEKNITLSGKKFFITHGHKYRVGFNNDRLIYKAQEENADICLYGHTHVPVIERAGNIVVMNPGSISSPRTSERIKSFGIIDINNSGIIDVYIMGVCNDGIKILHRG